MALGVAVAALPGAGLMILLPFGPSQSTSAALAALPDPLRLLALRSPGGRGSGALLSTKPPRVGEPGPPAGAAPSPRLSGLRAAPPAAALPALPAAEPAIEPGWLDGPLKALIDLPVGPGAYPPPPPLLWPWPGGTVVLVDRPPPVTPPTPSPVPEPSTWLMLTAGLCGVGRVLRLRRDAISGSGATATATRA